MNVIIVACAEYGVSRYIPPRVNTTSTAYAVSRYAVDDKITPFRAISGVNSDREAAIRLVQNLLVALAGCYPSEMKTYLPRSHILVVRSFASRDVDVIILTDVTPVRVAV